MSPSRADGARAVSCAVFFASSLAGCDSCDAPAPGAAASASASAASRASASAPAYVPPAPEGCARAGALEGLENDAACVVAKVEDGVMRETMKHLSLELRSDVAAVTSGGTAILRLALVNKGPAEVAVVLEAQPPGGVARPDWSRLSGVPEPRTSPSGAPLIEGFHIILPVRTLDAKDRSVDGLPWTPPAATAASPRLLRVRLRPGGKLTQTLSWWATRIPAPAPITRDDAGHRYVPKTAPVPLPPGDYTIAIDVPLYGVVPPESTARTHIRVDPEPRP